MNIIEASQDPQLFGPWFAAPTWVAWFTFLKTLFGLPFTGDDEIIYERHTHRTTRPLAPFREAWVVVGRRGGKSLVAALIAVFLACFKDYSQYLAAGEIATIAVIAADRKQARTILRYIRGFLELPMLRRLVISDKQESIELKGRVMIEVHTASFRSVRGYTFAAVICDEVAYFRTDDSAAADSELVAAVRPAQATIPNSLLIGISSPHARKGHLHQMYERHFGKHSPVLIWQGTTQQMNGSIDPAIIEQAMEEDEAAARAEYFAEFRRDLESFVSREAVDACKIPGRIELPPLSDVSRVGFIDPAGGSGADSMTAGIAHSRSDGKIILNCVREIRPPFSPEAAVTEFSEVLKAYGVTSVFGDRWGGEFCRELFLKHGINYKISEKTKSDIYLALLPLLNSGRIELLDNQRLISQLLNLERRTSRVGKDSVDHPSGAHDDLINAAAGAITHASKPKIVLGVIEYEKMLAAGIQSSKTTSQNTNCPECNSIAIAIIYGTKRCSNCGHQWDDKAKVNPAFTRKDITENHFMRRMR
jgi:hypothetical protein